MTLEQYRKSLVPSKKNQQSISIAASGKPFLFPSKQYQQWVRENMVHFEDFYMKLYDDGISLPVVRCKVKVIFYFPDEKDRDVDNKFLTIGDCLVEAGIVPMDSFRIYNDVHLLGYVNRAKPRTEIYITILTPDMPEYSIDKTPPEWYAQQKTRKNLLRRIQRDKKKRNGK